MFYLNADMNLKKFQLQIFLKNQVPIIYFAIGTALIFPEKLSHLRINYYDIIGSHTFAY